MDNNDRQAIDQLFRKLGEVEANAAPRDAEAEALIRQRVGQQPGAPYYMAQTIVVQEQALEALQQRILQLEQQSRPQGLFGGLFGGGSQRAPVPQQRYHSAATARTSMASSRAMAARPAAASLQAPRRRRSASPVAC